MLLDNNSLARLMNSSPNTDRSRLARELHDGLAQELAAIGYKLDSVIGHEGLEQGSRTQLRALRSNISALIEQVRNEIFELRNETNLSFKEIISAQIEILLSNTNISFQVVGEFEVGNEGKYELIRCIRELVLNSIAHSNCQMIQINLSNKLIQYSDDGDFIQSKSSNSYGLIGLQERLTKIGANLERSGSKFEIKFP